MGRVRRRMDPLPLCTGQMIADTKRVEICRADE